jgi:hypothetical protein
MKYLFFLILLSISCSRIEAQTKDTTGLGPDYAKWLKKHQRPDSITCACPCHDGVAGFFHCFGDCCRWPYQPRIKPKEATHKKLDSTNVKKFAPPVGWGGSVLDDRVHALELQNQALTRLLSETRGKLDSLIGEMRRKDGPIYCPDTVTNYRMHLTTTKYKL